MRRILVWPDVHYPYHSDKAVSEALRFARDYKPDTFVQLGDMYDCHAVSGHDRDPDKHGKLGREIDEANVEVDRLCRTLGGCEKYIVHGNHEDRVRRYVWQRAPALHGMFSLDDVFGLKSRGFKQTQYRKMLKLGKVHFSHDIGGSGKNAADAALVRVGGNIVVGHNHRAKLLFENNARQKPHFAMSVGWLGDPEQVVDYFNVHLAKTQWTWAFATIEMSSDGTAKPSLIPVF
jgi:predicted phosphodiesterase